MSMSSGNIQVAHVGDAHVIRLSGDVRLNLCTTLDRYVNEVLKGTDYNNVIVDLGQADGLDSTTLGQIAKIAIISRERFGIVPTISSPDPGITRILLSMGFDSVFHIVDNAISDQAEFREWAVDSLDEDDAREQVISAHKVLMSLNDKNEEEFRHLVDVLESRPH